MARPKKISVLHRVCDTLGTWGIIYKVQKVFLDPSRLGRPRKGSDTAFYSVWGYEEDVGSSGMLRKWGRDVGDGE